jgi:periplasmic protein TonB
LKSKSKKYTFLFALIICLLGISYNSFSKPLLPADDEYLLITEKMAGPVGGVDALIKKVLAETSLKGKGKLYLLVYVNNSGEVDDVKVVKGIGGNENKAIEIVEKTKFTPGYNGNTPVKSKVAIALNLN